MAPIASREEHAAHMMGSPFAVGSLVWVKIKGWPLWPCQVCNPELAGPEVLAARSMTRPVLVWSFGDHKYLWSAASSLSSYEPAQAKETSNRLLTVAMAEAAAAGNVPQPRSTQPVALPPAPTAPSVPRAPAPSKRGEGSDRPAQHLRPRGRGSAANQPARQTGKKRRMSEATGLFLNLPPALMNGTVSLNAADLFRARACAYSLFSALDEMLRPFELQQANDDSTGEEAAAADELPDGTGLEAAV